jgi:protein TonB
MCNLKINVMELKKSKKTNLERKRILFFEYGLLVALAFALFAFEWGTEDQKAASLDLTKTTTYIPEEMVEITRPELPKIKPPVYVEEILVIDDSEPDIPMPDIDWGDVKENSAYKLELWEPAEERVKEPETFMIVEKMPIYNGGDISTFQKDLQQLVKYPQLAQDLGIQGKVTLQFVINESGKLSNPQVIQSEHQLLTDAVFEALKKTKKWKAGEQRGRKVNVSFTIPVFFRLN